MDWFGTPAGQALLESETAAVHALLAQGRGLPWLWLAPLLSEPDSPPEEKGEGSRGLRLSPARDGREGWVGDVSCGCEWPLASESVDVVVLQHVLGQSRDAKAVLAECARVLVPGGTLGLFALNPLAPYRWRWWGQGLRAAEPLVWRRRLREVGLQPEPLSVGLGPTWRDHPTERQQQGAGMRAAYLLRAEKRSLPLTPVRRRRPALAPGIAVAT